MKGILAGIGLLGLLGSTGAVIVSDCGASGHIGVVINGYSQ